MRARWLTRAVALGACALASPAVAQPAEPAADQAESAADEPLTAEKIIEVARERLRPRGVRRPCKLPDNPNEIVVCGRNEEEELHVESSTDEAIREGRPVADGIPRAPELFPPCAGVCIPMGRDPVVPLIVDLTHMPEGLSPEDAARVYRVEDGRPREAAPVPEEESEEP